MNNTRKPITSEVTREDFCRFCHLLYDRHLVTGVGGNLSVRARGEIFVTPSGFSLRDVLSDVVTSLDDQGRVMDGPRPSKDTDVHLGILRSRPDINVVCHLHGANLIAATTLMDPGVDTIPPITPGFVYYAYPLEMVPFMVPGSETLSKMTIEKFYHNGRRALLLQNHGLITVGNNFSEALNIAEEIEEAARIFVLTKGKGRAIPEVDITEIKKLP